MGKSRIYVLTQRPQTVRDIAQYLFKAVLQLFKQRASRFYLQTLSVSLFLSLLFDILQLWDFHLRSVFKWSSSPHAPKATLENIISQVDFLYFDLFFKK